MPARRPPTDVHLVDFLVGVFGVLALKGRTRFRAEAGVLDRALRQTLVALRPVAERLRVRPRFRLAADALGRPRSNLMQALDRVERDGVIRRDGGSMEVTLSPPQAYVELEALPFPLAFAERAAKTFVRQHEIARIRQARSHHGASFPKE